MARLKYWLLLSRIPFLSVMIAPYVLGALLASRSLGIFSWGVFWFGLCGALLVQLIAHYSGEIYDLAEDRLSVTLEKNFFSGGSQVLVENIIGSRKVKILIRVVFFLAIIIGLILQFYFKTGKWTLLLGASGITCAYFYSKPPLRWVSRGIGEILIAYAFGWLSVNAGFYLQASRFDLLPALVCLPIACSVANIILINEYPDYPADKQGLKQNILVRIGKEKGAVLYALLVACGAATFFLALAKGLPGQAAVFYFPVFILALILAGRMLKGEYKDRQKLEKMCGLTIIVNLGTSLSCILGLLFG
ncbi:MAG: prenyltransferase [Candidatus Omnitrophica bacterium]|nr:prenyltransferase [Candidatus Omnitrophota bacterium]MBU4302927.1 prenyltransferase [Candidatus Omnitrophota bacterium]MBU4419241.1 prenyltransferase [Candidatus Omnitrophota bacterium]MBU4467363.1 prenyltransferase [Candidatus Omnitrophota bacterium]MCG2708455.1 prenyltransferase [Candidatus Omnitrophota bacterium]